LDVYDDLFIKDVYGKYSALDVGIGEMQTGANIQTSGLRCTLDCCIYPLLHRPSARELTGATRCLAAPASSEWRMQYLGDRANSGTRPTCHWQQRKQHSEGDISSSIATAGDIPRTKPDGIGSLGGGDNVMDVAVNLRRYAGSRRKDGSVRDR
jgi:hypothetical protein